MSVHFLLILEKMHRMTEQIEGKVVLFASSNFFVQYLFPSCFCLWHVVASVFRQEKESQMKPISKNFVFVLEFKLILVEISVLNLTF